MVFRSFSGQGADVVTYWRGECRNMVCTSGEREWYYNEVSQETGMYYYHYREWDGTEEEWINFFTTDTTLSESPKEWTYWGNELRKT